MASGATAIGVVLPALLTGYLAFQAGGFFPRETALVAVVLAVLLLFRVTLASRPFSGAGSCVVVASSALALLGVWTLLSFIWSAAPARALLEFDRVLVYLLAAVLLGSVCWSRNQLRGLLAGVTLAIAVICLAALTSRLLPTLLTEDHASVSNRLSFPITYWNALGSLAAVGFTFSLHFASSEREPPVLRVVGAGFCPALGATLLLTFSRGAIAAAAIAMVTYLALGHPRALVSGLLAVGPTTAFAARATYLATALVDPEVPRTVALLQGEHLASTIAASCLAAAAVRGLLLLLDRPLSRAVLDRSARRSGLAAWLAVLAVVIGVMALLSDRLAQPTLAKQADAHTDVRDRLLSLNDPNRVEHWDVAVQGFLSEPIKGEGAGTFAVQWAQRRPISFEAKDAHSLYLETLAELGMVGVAFLLLALGTLFIGLLWGMRERRRRALNAAIFAGALAWAAQGGIDWLWEIPAVTLWFFSLAPAAVAREHSRDRPPARMTRVITGLCCLLLAVTPLLVYLSQTRLEDAAEAFRSGDCTETIDSSLSSIEALSVRPEPFELLSWCDARFGYRKLALQAAEEAVARDPRNWEVHYGLALVRGSLGLNPRPAIDSALRLNPRRPGVIRVARALRGTNNPREWRRRARAASLPIAGGTRSVP